MIFMDQGISLSGGAKMPQKLQFHVFDVMQKTFLSKYSVGLCETIIGNFHALFQQKHRHLQGMRINGIAMISIKEASWSP
jgi:hypothetical protein